MRKAMMTAGAVALALVMLAGCGGGTKPQQNYQVKKPATQEQPKSQAQTKAETNAGTAAGSKTWKEPPAMAIDVNKSYTATMETSLGTMKIELFAKEVPKTVNNFVFLSRQGYYENVIFHRIIKGFMIQSGDPTGTGAGGPGYTIPDEYPVLRKYTLGTVAMARTAAPNSAGSQFFICTSQNCGGLDRQPNYVIFGQVVDGLDVLAKLESVEVVTGNSIDPVPSKPKNPPVIKKITIDEK
jgi:cyclophilin family peptidyl-prolyl cis-trans isomerase/outer membrane murein-binding lipoprotein Lpp